jgi:hypothetical protein
MVTIEKVRAFISQIAERPNNVTAEEIGWVVERLADLGLSTSKISNGHQVMYNVEGQQFGIATHHRGASQIKACYVRKFLAAMSNIGWYED